MRIPGKRHRHTHTDTHTPSSLSHSLYLLLTTLLSTNNKLTYFLTTTTNYLVEKGLSTSRVGKGLVRSQNSTRSDPP